MHIEGYRYTPMALFCVMICLDFGLLRVSSKTYPRLNAFFDLLYHIGLIRTHPLTIFLLPRHRTP